MHFLGNLNASKFVIQSITMWLQPQDGHCSDFLILKRLPSPSETLLPPFFNGSCVNILDIRLQLAHLIIKDVADVVTPDQALGDEGHHTRMYGTAPGQELT